MLFLANLHSGKGEVRAKGMDLLDTFIKDGWEVSVHTSQKRGDLPEYIRKEGEKFDLLVSCGGDGTLNETINGLMGLQTPPPLGYIPCGTVNDFASSLGIPKSFEEAAALTREGRPFCCDVGRFNDRYFAYVAAFGAFTDVSYQTPQLSKQFFGRLAYIVEGIKRLPTLKAYHLQVSYQGNVLEDDFIYGMVSNATSVGGFKFTDRMGVLMNDGLLEVTLIRFPRTAAERQLVLNGLLKQETNELITMFHTDSLSITSQDPLPWTLDGEYGGDTFSARIQNCPGAIRILVGEEALPAEAEAGWSPQPSKTLPSV